MRPAGDNRGQRRFAVYAWLVLAYNILVILWGAVVRATGSGAGCGEHWPLCEGQVIPHAEQIATVIEFAHRMTSGVAVVLVLALVYFAFRQFAKRHPARRYAVAVLFFTLTEGLIGAALVLFGQVGNNASMSRVYILSLHLVNTFLLLASLALTGRSAGQDQSTQPARESEGAALSPPSRTPKLYLAYAVGIVGTLAIAVTGTIAALGDTLFPAASLAQGLNWDFSNSVNPILRLRVAHPIVAVVVGGFVMGLAVHALSKPPTAAALRMARYLLALIVLQFVFGLLNIILLAPLWMQVLHLLTADLVWIALVLLTAEMVSRGHAALPEHPSGSLATSPDPIQQTTILR